MLTSISSGNMQKHGYLGCFHAAPARENISWVCVIHSQVHGWISWVDTIVAVIMLSNITWYCTQHYSNWGRTWIRICTNKRHTLRPRQTGRHFADDIFKCIFLNENIFLILNIISLKYVPYGLINNRAALVQIMTWGPTGDKPLFESMVLCFTDVFMHHLPKWVNNDFFRFGFNGLISSKKYCHYI